MPSVFLKNIGRGVQVLSLNPGFLSKRVFLGLKEKIFPAPKSSVYNFNGVFFDFNFSFSRKIKKMYFGTFQPIISEILKKHLKKGDTFIDVGANIGYFSFVAAQIVGKDGQVHSFEPVEEYFLKLENFSKLNSKYKIKANKLALGDKNKKANIFIKGGTDIGNNTFFPELLEGPSSSQAEVDVIRLDDYIQKNNLESIGLIKIDVEGFEFATLKGLSNYFAVCSKSGAFPVIVTEIVSEIYPKLGCSVKGLFDYMESFSYYPFNVLNESKKVTFTEVEKNRVIDVIFKHI